MLSNHSNADTLDSFCLLELFGRFTKYEENLYTSTEYVDDTNDVECDDGQECSVCLCQKVGYLRQLDCGHLFHNCCVNEWLLQEQTCPECRLDVTDEYLKENYGPTSSTPEESEESEEAAYSAYFNRFSDPYPYPYIYHYYAPPATGKTLICMAIAEQLRSTECVKTTRSWNSMPYMERRLNNENQQKQAPTIINNNPYKPKKSYKKYERRNENKRNSQKDLNRSNKLIRRQRY
jgi:hypothetical protein